MCGIAGATRKLLGNSPEATLSRMNEVMRHRGPDMGDMFFDESMGLCHRRLSIIDLSEEGRQPMHSEDGRYHIVFNGEIYNFIELRQELIKKGYHFHSGTDTEVLLKHYMEFGPESLKSVRGMFAYAIWDQLEKELFIARDRIGKKPLYYYMKGGEFAFASELKSILELPGIEKKIDLTAFVDYLKYLFIPHPKTIYENMFKLEPGHYLLLKNGELSIHSYWDVQFCPDDSRKENDLADELLAVIDDAVKCRLISDVPLGAFLSGGVDSSGVVSLMAKALNEPVTTCTIGFDSKKHNEADDARWFAERLHSRHHEHYIKNEPSKIINKLVWHFDEPFADSSMVPTYYVSNLARKNVTVAVSGDGGDESFAGYEKYSIDMFENNVRRWAPAQILNQVNRLTGTAGKGVLKKLHSLSGSALLEPGYAFYVTNTFITDQQLKFLLSSDVLKAIKDYDPSEHITRYYNSQEGMDHLSRILYTDLKMYLPGDILVKVDRMSMANALEVRSPLLDHKVIEFAAQIPSRLKMMRGEKKYILKKALRKELPQEILNRKKHGFEVPLDLWFRNELREMAHRAFFENEDMGKFFNIDSINKIWCDHQSGKQNSGTLLWSLLVFSIWNRGETFC